MINEDVAGRMSMHGNQTSFADGWWASIAMIEGNRVLCTSGDGESKICYTMDEVVENMSVLYDNAERASRFGIYNMAPLSTGVITVEGIMYLKSLLLLKHSHIATHSYRDGNLQIFTGTRNCTVPQRSKWCDVSMLVNNAAICSASNGDTRVCYKIDDAYDFVSAHI